MLDKRVFIWYNKLQDMKGDVFMAQISFRVDDDVKMSAEQTLDTIGLSMSSVLNVFLKTIAREKRIPFELTADPFYSASNMRYLEQKMEDYKAGKLKFAAHELIEE
jgi:DNA-damage-inducible protein J